MGIETTHPLFDEYAPDWRTMRDTYRGERAVKAAKTRYLPATAGMVAAGMGKSCGGPGESEYDAYRTRAVFQPHVESAVESLLGRLHLRPPVVELPTKMEYLLERCGANGADLPGFLKKINEHQLVYGRLGVMVDFRDTPAGMDPEFYASIYCAHEVRNWRADRGDQIDLVVLDETGFEMNPTTLEWDEVEKYRIISSVSGQYRTGVFERAAAFNVEELPDLPSVRGKTSEKIPFAFVNGKDAAPEPMKPPLLGLADTALAIYRAEADRRQTLFLQGQGTIVIIGANNLPADADVPVGAGAVLRLPATPGADAKYIAAPADGLEEMRLTIEADERRASKLAGRIQDSEDGDASGVAMAIRTGGATASLKTIARAGAWGLQHVLRVAADWIGEDPESVVITPNLDFRDYDLPGADALSWVSAKNAGFPISNKSLHAMAVKRGVTELSYDDEMDEIESDPEINRPRGGGLIDEQGQGGGGFDD